MSPSLSPLAAPPLSSQSARTLRSNSDTGSSSDHSRLLMPEQQQQQEDRDSIIHLCFALDRSETVQADFSCAIRSRRGGFPLHGRMYITQHFVCFYSNLFGHETKRALPFNQVTALNGRARFMMRNAVELHVQAGTVDKVYVKEKRGERGRSVKERCPCGVYWCDGALSSYSSNKAC